MAKLTDFMIGMVAIMVIIVAGFGALMAEMAQNYGVQDYNSTRISNYNKLTDMSRITEEIKTETQEIQSRSGLLDVLGGFFEAGYNTLKLAASSFGLLFGMGDQAIDDLHVANSGVFKAAFFIVIILVIFLGIIVSTVVKREL